MGIMHVILFKWQICTARHMKPNMVVRIWETWNEKERKEKEND